LNKANNIKELEREALGLQRQELTEHQIFTGLARLPGKNKRLLLELGKDKLRHYKHYKKITKKDAKPGMVKAWIFLTLGKSLGLLFTLRLLLLARKQTHPIIAGGKYKSKHSSKHVKDLMLHEKKIISLVKDERLDYAGSIVLGLNDALVEITGALAGLTLALQNSKVVAAAGLITGLAASTSMAASNYLATKEEPEMHKEHKRSPAKSALYTGTAYLGVVLLLVTPYLLIGNIFLALAASLTAGVCVVGFYSFYISTAKDKPFQEQFFTMLIVFLATAIISFGFGHLVKVWLGL
jgi:vacuolar iron transporter family protein